MNRPGTPLRAAGGLSWLILTLCFSFAPLAWSQSGDIEEPEPTRWRHPLGIQKPRHQAPPQGEPTAIAQAVPLAPQLEWEPVTPGVGRVCILVRDSIYGSIATALTQYEADLAAEGYTTTVLLYSSGDATSVRTSLANLYAEPASLVGAVLIGNIPYIIFEMMQDWDGTGGDDPEYDDFPCDLYYMDLDGVWSDTLTNGTVQPGNGKYDTWTGNRDLEIWTCRLKANNLSSLGTEAALLNSYFSRSHAYRQGTAGVGTTALVYADDDWQSMASSDTSCLNSVFGSGDVTSVSAPEATTANDYKTNRLVTNYQLTMIRSHGSPGGHGFYQNSHGTYERVNNWEYPLIDPGIEFHSLYVCSGCDHSYSDYLAGIIVFNPQAGGLMAWGSTKTGGMWQDSYYYNRLAAGEVFGDAFVYWFNYVRSHYSSYAPRWWYGMLLVGDATLRPFPEGVPPTPTASPTPSQTPTASPTPSLPDIDLSVEGGMLDFGNLDLSGSPSDPQWITILNTGNAELHFTGAGFVIGGIDAGHFGFSAPPDISPLVPAATRGVRIFFSPLSAGAKAAEVIVTSDDPDEPTAIVPLAGTAFLGIEDWMKY